MKKNLAFYLLLMLPLTAKAGEYALDFLRIGVGARAAALGGASTVLVNDAAAFYWNPAALTGIGRLSIHADHTALFDGLSQYNTLAAAAALRRDLVVGIGWVRLGIDDIPRYAPLVGSRADRYAGIGRSDGQAVGSFSDEQDAVLISFAKKITFDLGIGPASNMLVFPVELSVGAGGKFIRHRLDDKVGLGQGLDAGLLARACSRNNDGGEPVAWLGAAVSARDLTRTAVTWNTTSRHGDQATAAVQIGLAGSYYFRGIRSRMTAAFDQELGDQVMGRAGFEFVALHVASLRLGVAGKHLSAGAGLQFRRFRIDYAFVTHDLANSHRVSASVGW